MGKLHHNAKIFQRTTNSNVENKTLKLRFSHWALLLGFFKPFYGSFLWRLKVPNLKKNFEISVSDYEPFWFGVWETAYFNGVCTYQ